MTKEFAHFYSQNVPSELQGRWLFLPVGALEQHGPHLPLYVDTFLADVFCRLLADAVKGVVASAISYGARSLPASGGGSQFPGTVLVPGDILTALYRAVISGYVASGARHIFVLNGHWENEAFLFEALDQCRQQGLFDPDVSIISLSWWSVVKDEDMREIFGDFLGWNTEHAAQAETALMLHFAKDQVSLELAVDHLGHVPIGIYGHPLPENLRSASGSLGRSSHATAEMGEKLAAKVVDGLTDVIYQHPAVEDG